MAYEYILPETMVTAYRTGNILEFSTGLGNKEPIRKISKTEYVTPDGEIHLYEKHSKNRSENRASILKTMKNLRRLINHNFDGSPNELWITLTYAENQTDNVQVTKDFKVFMKKVRRRYPNMEYINVLEPQGRGAWHMHVLFKQLNSDYLYISNDELAKMWGHGYTYVKKLKQQDRVASYVTAYLTNVAVTDTSNVDFKDTYVASDNKRYIKGGRLDLYPRDMRFYRSSKGIKKPEKYTGRKKTIMGDHHVKKSGVLPDSYKKFLLPTEEGRNYILEKEFFIIDDD